MEKENSSSHYDYHTLNTILCYVVSGSKKKSDLCVSFLHPPVYQIQLRYCNPSFNVLSAASASYSYKKVWTKH